MKLENQLDRIHSRVTGNRFLQLFTAFTRVLLAIGFIPPSIPKILGLPFTTLPDTDPVGHYFNALLQTGFYYRFIGLGQIIAALLLLFPRTSHLGALMFFPIILNIAVLTNSVGFKGTWLITILMFLASVYLVCWDYDRWKTILFSRRLKSSVLFRKELIWLPLLAAGGAVSSYILLAYFLLRTVKSLNPKFIAILGILGLFFGLAVAVHHKFMKTGDLELKTEKL
ncbi:MAG: hypothetical protein R2747_02980 [Pyrinomonadaceae bacterium]